MWKEIFHFEIKYHLSQPLFYIAALALFLFGLLLVSTNAGVAFSHAPAQVQRNAPIVIVRILTFVSLIGLFVITAFVSSSALRDFERNTHMLFFTKPLRRFDYLLGRFAGSMAVSILVFIVCALGMMAGNFAPWQDPARLGAFSLTPYAFGFSILLLPNLLMMGGLFFAVTSWSRRPLLTYLCVVLFLVLQDEAEMLVTTLEHGLLAGLIEPAGITALELATRYWTISELNSALPGISGELFYNRLLWLGVGFIALIWSCARFNYTRAAARHAAKQPRSAEEIPPPTRWVHSIRVPRACQRFATATGLHQLWRQTCLEIATVVRSTPFVVLLVSAVILVVSVAWTTGRYHGTPIHPATHMMLRAIRHCMLMFLTIVVVIYGGESVWRERRLRLAEVFDTLPVSNAVFVGAKLLTLAIIVLLFIAVSALATVAVQIIRGYPHLGLGLYARSLPLIAWPYVLYAVLALFLQVVCRNKFVGFLLMIALLAGSVVLPKLGLEHSLCLFPGAPGMSYSEMNGYGHLLTHYLWVKLYWSFAAVVLGALAILFWQRGTENSLRTQLAAARACWRGPARSAVVLGMAGFFGTGAFIFYNTNILNEYYPRTHVETLQAEYEKRYRQYRDVPQPRITSVYNDVDIFPAERRVEIRGTYRLVNKTSAPITQLHVGLDPEVNINRLEPEISRLTAADSTFGHYIFELAPPLASGDSISLFFDVSIESRGFVDNQPNKLILRNGTFFNNAHYFPSLGYNARAELIDRNKRRKHGLPPPERMAPVNDLRARRNHYVSTDADWIEFETVVSTSADQIAIAPGDLQGEWEQGGRRYFHYKMDRPILNFYCYLSAEYAVRRDRWNDVEIAVYYHAPHDFNVARMIAAVKASLDYFTANFSPYQYGHVRIVEFPGYRHFAQAFPATIPYSESGCFIARMDRQKHVDYLFNTTAHEMAHQWWAHQVIGADVQGATMLSEALAEYSAMMVLEREYGPDILRRLLKYELDGYLKGRGDEVLEEQPLMLVEDQKYIHYNKGCLVMYALRDYIGEENMNHALADYVEQVAFQDPPYTNSRELIACLRGVTPDSLAYIVEDMFETITIFSNRTRVASYIAQDDGSYLVSLEVEAHKLRSDGRGVETEIAIDDWIDIGVFGKEEIGGREDEAVLYMKKHRIREPLMTFKIVVDRPPRRAGIDPYNKLIDRDSNDNVRKVEVARGPS